MAKAIKEYKDSHDFWAMLSESSLVAYDFGFEICMSLVNQFFPGINADLLVEDEEFEEV